MEHQHIEHTGCENNRIQLATRKYLFRLVSFLDRKLPEACAVYNLAYYSFHFVSTLSLRMLCVIAIQIQSFVSAAILTANPLYRVYFRRNFETTSSTSAKEEEDYSVIVGVSKENFIGNNEEVKVTSSHVCLCRIRNCT